MLKLTKKFYHIILMGNTESDLSKNDKLSARDREQILQQNS